MKEEKEKESHSQCCSCTCTSAIFSSEEEMDKLRDKVKKVSQALLAWLVVLILSPVLVLVFGSLVIWKYGILWVIVKLFKRKFLRGFDDSEGVFAVDRFWESSRSSLGLIVELEGTINVDTFRDEFRKKILDYSPNNHILQQNGFTSSSSSYLAALKPFAKLTEIPITFCGYYFWRKANYFLIHEHIRQINQPTDELGLKKAVGTLMTLPFPNRRPLWEILVYSNYLGTTTFGRGTTCGSALFIRIHRSVTDSEGLMNLLKHLLNSGVAPDPLKSIQIPSITVTDPNSKTTEGLTTSSTSLCKEDVGAMSKIVLEKLGNLVYFPLRSFQFAQIMIKSPKGIATSEEAICASSTDSANSSWAILSHSMIRKICQEQSPNLTGTTVEMTLFLEGITSRSKHKCLNVPEEKGAPVPEGKCQMRVLIPVPHHDKDCEISSRENLLVNQRSFVTVTCPCAGTMQTSSSKIKMALLRTIQNEVEKSRSSPDLRWKGIVKVYLRLLSLLPRHLLRYLIMSYRWGAGCFLYEQFQMELPQQEGDDLKQDLKLFGLYRVSQVVPLVGLQWAHTVASVATLKLHEENVVMSLIANAAILNPASQANPQEHVERIVRGFPEELERLAEDSEDHGFVSIPIQ